MKAVVNQNFSINLSGRDVIIDEESDLKKKKVSATLTIKIPSDIFKIKQKDEKKSKKEMFVCPICKEYSSNQEDNEMHILTTHSDNLQALQQKSSTTQGPPLHSEFNWNITKPPESFANTSLGKWRGIQGENNSCYLDATLFAMFAFITEFDDILKTPSIEMSEENIQTFILKERLKTDIVNELRSRGFVPSAHVVQFRKMIAKEFKGNDFNSACFEREVEEIISYLFKKFNSPPLYSFKSTKYEQELSGHVIQLWLPENTVTKHVSVSELLDSYVISEGIADFVKEPNLLILLTPRHSKKERVLDSIFPNERVSLFRATYELMAMCCIGLSHYVTYARSRDRKHWYFFDSMSDRENEVNIPEIKEVELEKLESEFDREFLNLKEIKRICSDVSVCIYVKKIKA